VEGKGRGRDNGGKREGMRSPPLQSYFDHWANEGGGAKIPHHFI